MGGIESIHQRRMVEEEMPRVPVTRRSASRSRVRPLGCRVPVFRASQPRRSEQDANRIEGGDTWWIMPGWCWRSVVRRLRGSVSRGVRARGSLSAGGRATRSRWPGWSPRDCSRPPAPVASPDCLGAAASGMEPRLVACRMVAFMVLLYVIYAGAVLLGGIGLGIGLSRGAGRSRSRSFPRSSPQCCSRGRCDGAAARRYRATSGAVGVGVGRLAHWVARAVTVPALAASGVRTAIDLIRARDPGLLGALAWWGFDICVLWACFHAFGPRRRSR